MNTESKLQIKNRMIKKAASLWGVAPNEIESSFDPIVSLLISACASEIEKLSTEFQNSQSRVTEQLIQLMTPEMVYGAKPAHGIIYVEPIEAKTTITPEHLLFYKKRVKTANAGQDVKNIYFSALQSSVLVDAGIKAVVCKDQLFEYEGKRKTVSNLKMATGLDLPPSTLYLGIKPGHKKIDLSDVSLYFELMDMKGRELFYHHLKNADFFFEGKPVTTNPGLQRITRQNEFTLRSVVAAGQNKSQYIEEQVRSFYNPNFVTITSKANLNDDPELPKEFKKLVDLKEHDQLEQLHWIKVVFPRVIDDSILKEVFCSLNAVPALNRRWQSMTYQLKDYVNIIPINTQELFLDIKSISNTTGNNYSLKQNELSQDDRGTFTIRRDNVGKLDSRKAKEYLLHLLDLLKDESASFSVFNNDFLQATIKELNQNIALLETKIADIGYGNYETSYVSIIPYRKKDTLLVEYWVTDGEDGNQIKQGNTLNVYQGSDLKQRGNIFLTTTLQGKNNLNMDERLNAYRRALLSRNRIVTKEDIKALCYEICATRVKNVTVTKGFKTAIHEQKGLVPSIDIQLEPNNKTRTTEPEWDAIKSNILTILEQQSLNVFPYRISITNAK